METPDKCAPGHFFLFVSPYVWRAWLRGEEQDHHRTRLGKPAPGVLGFSEEIFGFNYLLKAEFLS